MLGAMMLATRQHRMLQYLRCSLVDHYYCFDVRRRSKQHERRNSKRQTPPSLRNTRAVTA